MARHWGAPRGRMVDGRGQPSRPRASAWLWSPVAMAKPWPTHVLVLGAARAASWCRVQGRRGARHNGGYANPKGAQRCGHQESAANDWPHLGVTARYVYWRKPVTPQRLPRSGQAQCLAGLVQQPWQTLGRPSRQRRSDGAGLAHARPVTIAGSCSTVLAVLATFLVFGLSSKSGQQRVHRARF